MNSLHLFRAALAAFVVFGFLVLAPLSEAVAQANKANHIVLVQVEGTGDNAKCVTIPDTLYVTRTGRPVGVGFMAMGPNVEVTELDQKPGLKNGNTGVVEVETRSGVSRIKRDKDGQKLSEQPSLEIANQGDIGILSLNGMARGTYQYNVTCDGTPDDPPAIIVD